MASPRAALSPRDPVGESFRISTSPHLSHDEMQQLVRSRIQQARNSAAGLISRQRMRSPTKVSLPPGPDDEFVPTRPTREDAPEERSPSFGHRQRVALEPRASNDPETINSPRENAEEDPVANNADTNHTTQHPPLGSPTTPIVVDDVETKFDEQVSEGRFKWSFEESDSLDSDSKSNPLSPGSRMQSTHHLSIITGNPHRSAISTTNGMGNHTIQMKVSHSPHQYEETLSPLRARIAIQQSSSQLSSPRRSPRRSPLRKPRSPFENKSLMNRHFREKIDPVEDQRKEKDPLEERDGNLSKNQDPVENIILSESYSTRDPAAKSDPASNQDPQEDAIPFNSTNDEGSGEAASQLNASRPGGGTADFGISRCNSTLEEIDEHSRRAKTKASQLRMSLETKNREISKMVQKTQEIKERRLKEIMTPKGTRRNESEFLLEDDDFFMRRHRSSFSMPDASTIMSTRESAQDEINQMVKESIARAKSKVGEVSNSTESVKVEQRERLLGMAKDRKPEMDKMSMARINFDNESSSAGNRTTTLLPQTRKTRLDSESDEQFVATSTQHKAADSKQLLDNDNEGPVGLRYEGGLLMPSPANNATENPDSGIALANNGKAHSSFDDADTPKMTFKDSALEFTKSTESSECAMSSQLGKSQSNDSGTISSLSQDELSFYQEGKPSYEGSNMDPAMDDDAERSVMNKGGEWVKQENHPDTLEITPSQLGSKSRCRTPYNSMSDSFSTTSSEQEDSLASTSSEQEQHVASPNIPKAASQEEQQSQPASVTPSSDENEGDPATIDVSHTETEGTQKLVHMDQELPAGLSEDQQNLDDSGTLSSSSNRNTARYDKKKKSRKQQGHRSTRSRNTHKGKTMHGSSLDEQERESWLLEGLTYGFDRAADRFNEKMGFVNDQDEGSMYNTHGREKEMQQLGSFAFSDAEDAFTEVDEEEQNFSMSLSDDSSDNAFTSKYSPSDGPSSYEDNEGCQIM